MRGTSSFPKLISFYDKVTHVVIQGKAVMWVLRFNKAFDTVFHSVLLDEMSCTQLLKFIIWLGGAIVWLKELQ